MSTPLLIPTRQEYGGVASGIIGSWSEIKGIDELIDNILTHDLNVDASEDEITAFISGIPSPWARALVFRYALNLPNHRPNAGSGVARYCRSLQDEWKGLLACIALHNDRISVARIDLAHSVATNHPDYEFYELKGALGRMLFDDAQLWTDRASLHDHTPFLQAIYLDTEVDGRSTKVLIGSTSPHSILFCPPIIRDGEAVPFCNGVTKRFVHPLTVQITPSQVQLLYDYVRYMRSRIAAFGAVINQGRPESTRVGIDRISEFLLAFLQEIESHALRMRALPEYGSFSLNRDNLISTEPLFKAPFDIVLNAESNVYLNQKGVFYLDAGPGMRLYRINDLLQDPAHKLIEVAFSSDEKPEACAAHLLRANDKYFALPFSQVGLRAFQDHLEDMLSGNTNPIGTITAEWVGGIRFELRVTLKLKVRKDSIGEEMIEVETTKVYATKDVLRERIAAWPNFITDEVWQDYYLYSELPHNAREGVKAWPLLWDADHQRIRETDTGSFAYACRPSISIGDNAASPAEVIVPQKDTNGVGLQYEIYHSKVPIVGIELRVGAGDFAPLGGYLIGKTNPNARSGFRKIAREDLSGMSPVSVGFDLGSNNTCVCYCQPLENPELVHFKNRRVMLLGSDAVDLEGRFEARADELFFFQKEQPLGKFRSMMIVHQEGRLVNPNMDVRQVGLGGFPAFAQNIPIKRLNHANRGHDYILEVSNAEEKLKYNMKWAGAGQVRENGYKYAFVKTIWLMINAELFEQRLYPTRLSWAYPFAMRDGLYTHYQSMWNSVSKVLNLGERYKLVIDQLTESEAVAEFITGIRLGGMAPSKADLSIGFDVGGSTTDILFLVQRGQKDCLLRQSSLLIAAGMVTRAAENSLPIREAIRSFVLDRSNPLKINGVQATGKHNGLNADTGPFYFNTVLDRLQGEHLQQLYNHFYENGGKGIFVQIAYVTGLLLFYAGQVAASILQEGEYPHIERINLGFFGKGGNIFTWIMVVLNRDGKGKKYFEECFKKGMHVIFEEAKGDPTPAKDGQTNHAGGILQPIRNLSIHSTFRTDPATNKAEVAYGLAGGRHLQQNVLAENRKDLIGERGFSWVETGALKATQTMTPTYLQELGEKFDMPRAYPNLEAFVGTFADFVQKDAPGVASLAKANVKTMGGLRRYIQELPQYKDAAGSLDSPFDFSSPMIVLAGMYLFDTVVLPQCADIE